MPIIGNESDLSRQRQYSARNGQSPGECSKQLTVAGSLHGRDANDLAAPDFQRGASNARRSSCVDDRHVTSDNHRIARIRRPHGTCLTPISLAEHRFDERVFVRFATCRRKTDNSVS